MKKRTLWKLLKVFIAMFYVLLGVLLFLGVARFVDWRLTVLQGTSRKVIFWVGMVVEIIPLLLIVKGSNYLKKRFVKILGKVYEGYHEYEEYNYYDDSDYDCDEID